MSLVKSKIDSLVKHSQLSPYKRPVVQGYLETAVSNTVKQLGVSDQQRDQHRVLRAITRMACRISIWMGYSLKEHLSLVAELYQKCLLDHLGKSKGLPAKSKASKPSFHNSMKELSE